mgnify:CR=1 FL=1
MNTNSVNFNSKKINNKNNNKNQMAISKMKIRIISENNNNNNNNNNNKIPSELKKIINSSISKVNNNKYIYEEKPIFYDRLYDNIKEKPFTASASINRTSLNRYGGNGLLKKNKSFKNIKEISNFNLNQKKNYDEILLSENLNLDLEKNDPKNEGVNKRDKDKKKVKKNIYVIK